MIKILGNNCHFLFILISNKKSLFFSPISFSTIPIQKDDRHDAALVQQQASRKVGSNLNNTINIKTSPTKSFLSFFSFLFTPYLHMIKLIPHFYCGSQVNPMYYGEDQTQLSLVINHLTFCYYLWIEKIKIVKANNIIFLVYLVLKV
jgi:hypothetical protein